MPDVFDLRALVSADVTPFNTAMDKSAESVTQSLSTIKTATDLFIGSGFVRTFIKATDAAYTFGQAMTDISAISDVSMQKLSKSIMQLENVYGKVSTVGDAIYETISSGVRGSEADLINFQKVAAQTAVSIKADLYDTTNVLTTLTNAYGLSISDAQKLSDMLFVTVREGKAHGNELAKTLGLVTNTAAEAGVSLSEMAAVISVLSRTQSASQSMIGFNQMLNSLIKPTIEARQEAAKWGIEIGATALKNKGLTAILTEMHDKLGGNVEAINALLGNIRAMRAGTALTGRQFDNFIEVLKTAEREIGSGAAMQAFETQTATAAQSVKNLKTQIDKTLITVGNDFEPVMTVITKTAEDVARSFADSNGIIRWSTYLSAAYVTLKSIKDVVNDLRAGIERASAAFSNMASSAGTVAGSLSASAAMQAGLSSGEVRQVIVAPAELNRMSQMQQELRKEQSALHIQAQEIHRNHMEELNTLRTKYEESSRALRSMLAEQKQTMLTIKRSYADLQTLQTKSLAKLQALRANPLMYQTAADLTPIMQNAHLAGGRSLTGFRRNNELVNALAPYLSAVSSADPVKVLEKALNPSMDAIYRMASDNMDKMYHVIRDNAGNVVAAYDSNNAPIDHKKVLKQEVGRIDRGFANLREKVLPQMESAQKEGMEKRAVEIGGLEAQTRKRKDELTKMRRAITRQQNRLAALAKQQADDHERYVAEQKAIRQQMLDDEKAFRLKIKNSQDAIAKLEQERAALLKRQRALMLKAQASMIERGGAASGDMLMYAYDGASRRDLLAEASDPRRTRRSLARERLSRMGTKARANITQNPLVLVGLKLRETGYALDVATAGIKNATRPVMTGFSAVAGKLASVVPMVSAAFMGWEIGKAIGKHLNAMDWAIIKATARIVDTALGYDTTDRTEQGKQADKANAELTRKRTKKELDKLKSNKKIGQVEYEKYEKRLNDTTDLKELGAIRDEVFRLNDIPILKSAQELTDSLNKLTETIRGRKGESIEIRRNQPKPAQLHAENRTYEGFLEDEFYSMYDQLVKYTGFRSPEIIDRLKKSTSVEERRAALDDMYVALDNEYKSFKSKSGLATVGRSAPGRPKSYLNMIKDAMDKITEVRGIAESALVPTYSPFAKEDIEWVESDARGKALRDLYSGSGYVEDFLRRGRERQFVGLADDATKYTLGAGSAVSESTGWENIKRAQDFVQKLWDDQKKAQSELEKVKQAAMDAGVDKKSVDNATQKVLPELTRFRDFIITSEEHVNDAVKDQMERITASIDDYMYDITKYGASENSNDYAVKVRRKIDSQVSRLYKALAESTTKESTRLIQKTIDELKNKAETVESRYEENISKRENLMVDAGRITRTQADYRKLQRLRKRQAHLQEEYSNYMFAANNSNDDATRGYMTREAGIRADALRDVSLEVATEFKKVSDAAGELSNSIMSSVQGIVSSKGLDKRMDNNTLYHSINMLSRFVGSGAMMRAVYPTASAASAMSMKPAQARANAERNVLNALDSYIMSQKYAEAHLGKTVANIYDYMKSNKTIMVSE